MVNCIIFLPISYFLLRSGNSKALFGLLIIQMVYQGFIPGLIGVLLVTHASNTLVPATASAILAAVLGVGELFGMVFLQEVLGLQSWVASAFLTLGLLYTTMGTLTNNTA
jgi:drug/metabolite transporter (DMT)-like permease